MTHRVGIIGLGTVGSRFVEQFQRHRAFELVAAWDADTAACAAHEGTVDIAHDAAEVIGAADVVYVAVPPRHHDQYVRRCLAARTAVFCEKPLTVDVPTGRALAEEVAASGRPAAVNFVFSAAPAAVRLEADVSGGTLGAVAHAELRVHLEQWPRAWQTRADWLRSRDQGGWIREIVSHFVFLAARLLGPVTVDDASLRWGDGPSGTLCETDALVRLDAGGTPLLVTGTSGGAGPDVVDFTVRGVNGARRLHDWYHLQSVDDARWADLLGGDRAGLATDAYEAQLDQLATMLAGRPHRLATFAEAFAVQDVIERVLDVTGQVGSGFISQ